MYELTLLLDEIIYVRRNYSMASLTDYYELFATNLKYSSGP